MRNLGEPLCGRCYRACILPTHATSPLAPPCFINGFHTADLQHAKADRQRSAGQVVSPIQEIDGAAALR